MTSHQQTQQSIRPEMERQYQQGLANLALEGLHLSREQDRLVRDYHAGRITKAELIGKTAENARA